MAEKVSNENSLASSSRPGFIVNQSAICGNLRFPRGGVVGTVISHSNVSTGLGHGVGMNKFTQYA